MLVCWRSAYERAWPEYNRTTVTLWSHIVTAVVLQRSLVAQKIAPVLPCLHAHVACSALRSTPHILNGVADHLTQRPRDPGLRPRGTRRNGLPRKHLNERPLSGRGRLVSSVHVWIFLDWIGWVPHAETRSIVRRLGMLRLLACRTLKEPPVPSMSMASATTGTFTVNRNGRMTKGGREWRFCCCRGMLNARLCWNFLRPSAC